MVILKLGYMIRIAFIKKIQDTRLHPQSKPRSLYRARQDSTPYRCPIHPTSAMAMLPEWAKETCRDMVRVKDPEMGTHPDYLVVPCSPRVFKGKETQK